jgi:hypothetical protein
MWRHICSFWLYFNSSITKVKTHMLLLTIWFVLNAVHKHGGNTEKLKEEKKKEKNK